MRSSVTHPLEYVQGGPVPPGAPAPVGEDVQEAGEGCAAGIVLRHPGDRHAAGMDRRETRTQSAHGLVMAHDEKLTIGRKLAGEGGDEADPVIAVRHQDQ
ncbi:MAG: hypothetical protein J0H99_23010, partial [Rhodospirillales bacterium]|nr:hypothetical protein [Rhodospirillales bacterium]